VRIKECHLEEDAGKMIHTGAVSLLDYNRAGVSLLEIVTEPDMESGEEAELFIQELRRMVRYLGVCDGNMEEGSLRADANVSINFPGQGLGRKVEIKNLNSSRFVRLGLDYEIKRQGELLDSGRTVTQETRLWNENRDETMPMRHKENAQDYRYFPEPDLPVFCPGEDFRNSVEASLVELPRKRMKRMMGDYGLSEEQAELICDEKEGADYFEAAVSEAKRLSPDGENRDEIPLRIANWFLSDIKHILNREGIAVRGIASFKLSPARFASLVTMLCTGRITGKIAKQCLDSVIAEDRDPEEIVKANDWEQLTDPERISATVEAVFAAETATVTELRGIMTAARGGDIEAGVTGKAGSGVKPVDGSREKRRRTLTAYLVGKVIAATGGRADPKLAGQHVEKLLKA
jgi:aspartyl-tRNA(Asn)/glutamyl-tRNA(Gln) amidotransferase subunit B